MSMTEILNKYTAGQTTLEETNAALAEMGAGIHLEPGKNELTAEETAAAKADSAATANGFGLLDTGTGTLDIDVFVFQNDLFQIAGEVVCPFIQGGNHGTVKADLCGSIFLVGMAELHQCTKHRILL